MKIGILTFNRALNYGAVWQCYALKQTCESLGHVVETIDYNPFGHYTVRGALRHSPSSAYRLLKMMYQFNRFVNNYLNPTIHTESHDWIKQNPPQDDIYIVGSDQVWANEIVGDYLNSYLLDFSPARVKRIAYAASTAGNMLCVDEQQLRELKKFSAISVREKHSISDIQEKVDISIVDVCDPSLLLKQEDYEPLEQKPIWLPKHYLAYFNLAGDPFCENSAHKLGDQLDLPIVNVAGKYKKWAKRNYIAPTPEQWLYIMHHADFICTNSFHGVAFSIIFRRPFIYCEAKNIGHSQKINRIQNLLEQTHLLDRYITDISQIRKIAIGGEFADNERFISLYRAFFRMA